MKWIVLVILVFACKGKAFESDSVFELWIGKSFVKRISSYFGEYKYDVIQSPAEWLDKRVIIKDAQDAPLMVFIAGQMSWHAFYLGNTKKRDLVLAFEDHIPPELISQMLRLGFGLGYNRIILYRGEACSTKIVEVYTDYNLWENENTPAFAPEYKTQKIRLAHDICGKKLSENEIECRIMTSNYLDEQCPLWIKLDK